MNMQLSLTPTVLWLVLVAATFLSFTLAEDTNAARVAATVAMLIGAFKARLIFIYFMEVRWEPRPYRIVFELWTVAATVLILGGYWLTALKG